MKAIVLTETGSPEIGGSGPLRLQALRASLEGLDIRYERQKVQNITAAGLVSAGYDFVIIPRTVGTNVYKALIDSASLTIPVFVLEATSIASTQLATTPGITGTASAYLDTYVSVPWTTSPWVALEGVFWPLASPGVSLITAQATDPRTGSAQTLAGQTCMWHVTKPGAGRLYCSSINQTTQPVLALMLQAAYNLGDFTAAQMASLRKLPVSVDQDHLTGNSFYNSETVLRRWLDKIPDDGVSWSGITSPYTNITGMNATVKSLLQQARTDGRIKCCYHDHTSGKEVSTGAWPVTARGGTLVDAGITKATQDTNYTYLKGVWEGAGGEFNQPGFYVPATNRWNEDTLLLMSPQTSLASDPANTTPRAGYGFSMVRYSTSNNCTRPCPVVASYPRNVHMQREYFAGMTFIPGTDMALEDAISSVGNWRQKFQYLCQGLHYGISLYFHDEDFVDAQNPVSAEFGSEVLQQLVDAKAYLKNVSVFFADQTHYSLGITQR